MRLGSPPTTRSAKLAENGVLGTLQISWGQMIVGVNAETWQSIALG